MTSGPEVAPPRIIVSVTEIRRRPGTRIDVHRTLEAEGLSLPDIGVGVPDGAEVVLDGELESIHEGVVLTGQVTVPWTGECRRCLKEVGGDAVLDIREVFETKPTDGETWPIEQDHIDVGPLLHDNALLALPLAPLCSEDCAGPVPEAFMTADDGDDQGDGAAKDPRWAALDDLDLN